MKTILYVFTLTLLLGCGGSDSQTNESEVPIEIWEGDFLDNSGNYVNKLITLKHQMFFQSDQKGGEDVYGKKLNLRSEDDELEDLRTKTFFSSFVQPDDNNKFYYRTVTLTTEFLVTIKIPKAISMNVPNMLDGAIVVTGRVISPDLILVNSIERY